MKPTQTTIVRQPIGQLPSQIEEVTGGALSEDLKYLWKNPTRVLTKLGQTAYGITLPISGLLEGFNLIKGAANYAASLGESLPPIQEELSLFQQQAQDTTNPYHQRNQMILTKLADLAHRYNALNQTAAKDTLNRILHVTAINSIRDPKNASQHLAKAELDLGKLNRRFLSSPGSKGYEAYKKADEEYKKADELKRNMIRNPPYRPGPEDVDPRLVGIGDQPSYPEMFFGTYLSGFRDDYGVVPKPAITDAYRKAAALPSQLLLEAPMYAQYQPLYYKQDVSPAPAWIRPQPVPGNLKSVNRKKRPDSTRGKYGRRYIDDSTR